MTLPTTQRWLTPDEVRRFMVGHCGLRAVTRPDGPDGVRNLLAARRCIQLDPIDRIGTNADLIAFARVDGIGRGDVHHHVDGHSFEHFAKMRCLLPAECFPIWRHHLTGQLAYREENRMDRLTSAVVEAVYQEIAERGPMTSSELSDQGRVRSLDWSGWKGTSKAATMALEVLWNDCRIIVRTRRRGARVYDLPERALPAAATAAPPEDPLHVALVDRIEAAGLLPEVAGPWWAMLTGARSDGTVEALIAEGRIERVAVAGMKRTYLAPAGFAERSFADDDGRMRILAPLDPLLWYRPLVQHAFDFEYIWEIYKPAAQRRWGYYVCPLLHEGQLVGRFEGRFVGGEVVVDTLWREPGRVFSDAAFSAALERHAAALGR